MRRLALVFGIGALLIAACGDDGGSAGEVTATTGDVSEPAATLPPGCEEVPFEITARAEGSGPPEPVTIVYAEATRKLGGKAYFVQLLSWEPDPELSLFEQLENPPAGGITIQAGLDIFNADDPDALPVLQVGDVGQVDWTAGELAAIGNVFQDAEGGTTVDSAGSAELIYVDDEQICISADITSESGNVLQGIYLAPITDDF